MPHLRAGWRRLAQVDAIEAGCRGPVRRRVLPGGGHSPHRERPDGVLAAMADFVREVGEPGPPGGGAARQNDV